MKALALFHLKGGVGKTTTAVHMAHRLAAEGRATLLWDLDPQGAASYCFRVRVGESSGARELLRDRRTLWAAIRGSDFAGLDVLPADLSLRKLEGALRREEDPEGVLAQVLADLATRYTRIVLDCPPGLSRLTECVLGAVSAVVVPTIPTPLSLRTLAALHVHLKPLRARGLLVLPFFSMVDPRKAMHREVRAFVRREGLGFLNQEIPYSAQVERAAARREPLTAGADRQGPAAAFVELAREVEGLLELGSTAGVRPARLQHLLETLQGPLSAGPRVPEENGKG